MIEQIAMFQFDIIVATIMLAIGIAFRKDLFLRNNLFVLGTLYLFFALLWHAPIDWSNLY